jgi:hypothetical protein
MRAKNNYLRAKKTICRIWYATSKLIPGNIVQIVVGPALLGNSPSRRAIPSRRVARKRTRALLGGIALLGGLLPPRAGPTTICTLQFQRLYTRPWHSTFGENHVTATFSALRENGHSGIMYGVIFC